MRARRSRRYPSKKAAGSGSGQPPRCALVRREKAANSGSGKPPLKPRRRASPPPAAPTAVSAATA
eukprot:960238-Heterocapsa_arctica.AAC.1